VILVVAAVPKELAWLVVPPECEVLFTGVGPVEAATAVSRALATRSYTVVINAGIAGALPGVASVGDAVVVADEFLELDLETGAPIALPDGERIIDRVAADALLVDTLRTHGFKAVRGVTVSRVTATDATAARLRDLGAEVESMEGFAVLRAARRAGVRAVEVRGISNLVGARERSAWNFAAGLYGLQRILTQTLAIA
jgi:futalosine hydrolase